MRPRAREGNDTLRAFRGDRLSYAGKDSEVGADRRRRRSHGGETAARSGGQGDAVPRHRCIPSNESDGAEQEPGERHHVLWLFGRYDGVVYAIDTTRRQAQRMPAGKEPPGLTVWPQPGRYSLGHTGNTR